MKRYILTGTPGCGKTSLIRALEINGASVVNEAATDIIAYQQTQGILAPWENPNFIDDIIKLQKHRQIELNSNYSLIHFYDRSPICTHALAMYLGFELSPNLLEEIKRIQDNQIYEKRVFFIENLGFITNTDARKISFEDSLKFEKIHRESYTKFGYECINIPPVPLDERMNMILRSI